MWRPTRWLSLRLTPDPSLVVLPAGVRRVEVYRNAVSSREESIIWDELSLVLEREGQKALSERSTPQSKIVKHTYLEMHGDQRFTEVRSWQRKELRRLPGLVWSPTLMACMRDVAPALLGSVPDTARVVEHNMPGYEMHIEHPTVGCCFLYLSLLSDTVLSFDDEPTGRRGQVFLPQRSLMRCSGEARWGWRFGEQPNDTHTFISDAGVRRVVETDMRLSVQLWRFTPQLLDARVLQDRVEASIRRLEERENNRPDVEHTEEPCESPKSDFTAASVGQNTGGGPLGGDYAANTSPDPGGGTKITMGTIEKDYDKYKQKFQNVHGVLQEMKALQDAGQPINDMWLKRKILDGQGNAEQDTSDGFDAEDVEGTWDRVDARARFYKARLKSMDYDGSGSLNNTMPDITEDAPLDMKKTIRKIAPLVKDGEKIVASFPGLQ
ncbi:hypothetical protein C3747_94g179 [Trypanosoma cruzi]|uniref:Uncharacterized protein n=3 Tax=Trypanosoma cruzi TaxID=5693 RepID=Q4D853_TRYCC|nr:hypothetical protein, conserved [Trypanosoma cruzi]EAN88702.1 hypothetical protein, conserved [Trypanosoma cruzi]KAF8297873.1 hypothetical protein TcYC6_0077790 [Trypanosoma cruzi]KAF8297932.1 hypothetical protein TcYC6_0078010 [Trypanosoma cruzi]PWV08083.1 hypothetical protein C3747_94g179 [Trypanosoma cruzi]RNC55825.1 hypothetical protein TcCL_ESM06665 [Trypanosoma cruzi]|eukprot:XP_810553.1 hypothetical protein [Trypanosoma cruzi strain CL Brener]